MKRIPIYNRIQFRLLLPVVIVGIVCSTLLVNYLSTPLKDHLTRQFDTNLRTTSMMGLQFCEEGFNYLIELRLEKNREMNQLLKQETLLKIKALSKQFHGIHLAVTDSKGAVIASSLEGTDMRWKSPFAEQLDDKPESILINGKSARSHVQFFPYWDWQIISFVFEADYQAPVRMAYRITYLSAIGVFLVVLATLMLFFHLLIRKPLNRLMIATEGVAEGRFIKVEKGKNNELGRLTSSFNDMIDSLDQQKSQALDLIEQLQESEALFRSQFESGNIGIALSSPQEGWVRVNRQLCEILEYSEEELQQISWPELTHPDDLESDMVNFERMLNGEIDSYELDKRVFNKSGRMVYAHVTVSCHRNPDRSVNFTIISLLDISVRKRFEEELKRNASFTNALLNAVPTPVFYKDREGRYQGCNQSFTNFVGSTQEEIEGRTVTDLWPSEQAAVYHQKDLELMENPQHQMYEFEVSDKHGQLRPVVYAKDVFRDEDGNVAGIVGAFLDITDLKAAEKAQVEANRMLKLVLNSIPVRVFWKDRDSVYMGANQPFAEDASMDSPDELVGKTDFDLIFARQAEMFRQIDIEIMQSGESKLFCEEPQERPDGSTKWLLTSKVPMLDEQQKVIGVLGTYQDITDRKRAEEEVRNLRNYLSNIINSMPSVLIGVDGEGRITQWNDKARQVTGISQDSALGLPYEEVYSSLSEGSSLVQEAISENKVCSDPRHARIEDNQMIYEDITIFPLAANGVEGAVIRIDDITEQIHMEEMMVQSEKMLSVGGLAAGMAHEINNPLAGMIQSSNIMKSRLEDLDLPANRRAAEKIGVAQELIREFMQERGIFKMLVAINESGKRVSDIVKNMLSFARKSDATVSSYQPEQLLDTILELAATDYNLKKQYDFKSINIVREYADNLPMIPCEASKIQQVFLNILRNGAEALQAADSTVDAEPCFIIRIYVDQAEDMLKVEIEDNGPGMGRSVQARIFEPFFTTKPIGVGTGLGLSVSYFIITQNHGGTMEVKSTPGQGSTFIIGLPLGS